MGEAGASDSEPDKSGSGLTGKVIYPVVVAVLAAVIIALLTGGFGRAKSWVFPTKVTVTGKVVDHDGGRAVPGVTLTLDGSRVDPTDVQGEFSISGVGVGSHELVLKKVGYWTRKHEITVGKNDTKLEPLALEQLVRVGFALDQQSQTFSTVDYRAQVWLFGRKGALKQVRAVRYVLPDWMGKAPLAASRAPFCYSANGPVGVEAYGQNNWKPVKATVTLRNGGRFLTGGFPNVAGDAPSNCQGAGAAGQPHSPIKEIVPDVVGQPLLSAQAMLRDRGFDVTPVYTASSKSQGVVISQSLAPGSRARKGTRITLTVSKGGQGPHGQGVTVPSVVGESLASATATLQSRGLKVRHQTVDSGKPANQVVAQTPVGGTSVVKGATVNLTISSGPTQATVPDVVGETAQQATQDLVAAGFKVTQQFVTVSDPSDDNVVTSQNPAGGSSIPRGSTVTIAIGQYSGP